MKKLMIAAAIVCVTVAAQAASVTWNSGSATAATYLVDATDKKTKLGAYPEGMSVVLIKLAAADLASFQAGTWSAKTATELQTASLGSSGKSQGKLTGTFNFAYDDGTVANNDYLAAVLKSSDGYTQLTYAADGKAVTDYMQVSGMSDNMWSGSLYYAQSGNVIAAVPEPTSGLLLLLGVAGLALRRRRA